MIVSICKLIGKLTPTEDKTLNTFLFFYRSKIIYYLRHNGYQVFKICPLEKYLFTY